MTGHELIRALQAVPERDLNLPIWVLAQDHYEPDCHVIEIDSVVRGSKEDEKYYNQQFLQLWDDTK